MIEHEVLYDMASVCERWGATEAQVLEIAAYEAGLMDAEHVLPNGSPLWDSVGDAEKVLPELVGRDAKGAIEALRGALAAADDQVGFLPADWNARRYDWIGTLLEERWTFIREVLEHRQECAA